MSPLVSPMLIIAIGFPSSDACKMILNPENTDKDEPKTKRESLLFNWWLTLATLSLGTLSPKKTISGFKIPAQCGQSGITKFSTSACKKSY